MSVVLGNEKVTFSKGVSISYSDPDVIIEPTRADYNKIYIGRVNYEDGAATSAGIIQYYVSPIGGSLILVINGQLISGSYGNVKISGVVINFPTV